MLLTKDHIHKFTILTWIKIYLYFLYILQYFRLIPNIKRSVFTIYRYKYFLHLQGGYYVRIVRNVLSVHCPNFKKSVHIFFINPYILIKYLKICMMSHMQCMSILLCLYSFLIKFIYNGTKYVYM